MMENIISYSLSQKLNQFFKNNIKFSIVSEINVIIITKDDECYEFERNDLSKNIKNPLLVLSDEIKSIIAESFVEELSHIKVIDFKNSFIHSIARNSDGHIYCWGDDTGGLSENGSNSTNDKYKPKCNKFLSNLNVIEMCCGHNHTLVLTITGDVYAWGRNNHGQIGNGIIGEKECQLTPFKLNKSRGEKVKGISCGSNHSMALTESGQVYSWGQNQFGQLGIGNIEESSLPKHIELDLIVEKISCGSLHSLFLTIDGDIYVCGRSKIRTSKDKNLNFLTTPTKLNHSTKFKDIASHFSFLFSAAISVNSIIYIWGESKKEVITEPKETTFNSFNDVFEHHLQITYKPNERRIIQFYDEFTQNGKYENKFINRRRIGGGSYGEVFEVIPKTLHFHCSYAIKLIKFTAEDKKEFLAEFETSPIIYALDHENVIKYSDFWLENDFTIENGTKEFNKNFILYILMELCDKSLDKIIEEIEDDSNMYLNGTLTHLGYYYSSKIFIDILKGVDYLHTQKSPIIHRDLKPENIIMLRSLQSSNFTIKIADMGLATLHKFLLPSVPSICDSETLHTINRGTIGYIAPEVEEAILDNESDKARYDTKADIYSLGVIFKKLLHINLSSSYQDSLLHNKYEVAKCLSIRMSSENPTERPDCGKMIKRMHLWTFTEEELNTFTDIKKNFESYDNYYLFVDRLQHNKFKRHCTEIQKIGEGSFGKVYKVREGYNLDESKNRFAIKIIKFPTMYEKEFIKEIRSCSTVGEINHGNIVKYFNIWLESNFIVEDKVRIKIKSFSLLIRMELCDKTLAEFIAEMKNDSYICSNKFFTHLGYYIASKIFSEILEGVHYLHIQNPPIIHRYLNPLNIMLKIDYYNKSFVKITNPSLSAIYKYTNHSNNQDKNHKSYMAAEIKNAEEFDTRADIFSLGVILRELFFIDSKRDNVVKNESQSKYFQEILYLCEKMTQKRAKQRPDSIEDILKEMHLWDLNVNDLHFNEDFVHVFESYDNNESYVLKLLEKILFNVGFIQNDVYGEELEKIKISDCNGKVTRVDKDVWQRLNERLRLGKFPHSLIEVQSIEEFLNDQNEQELNQSILKNENQLLITYPSNIVVDQDLTKTADMFVLHNYVKEWCRVSENQFYLNIKSNNKNKRMSFGTINEWTQRCSVTSNMTLVRNGLKPIRNSVNKFVVNQINEKNEKLTGIECEIEFVNNRKFCRLFPFSKNCKIIATNRGSKLVIMILPYNQSNKLIGIRPDDGFVLVHTRLSVFDTPKPLIKIKNNSDIYENNNNELKSFYDESENGHLFILEKGGHLLIIDKPNERCFLLVGFGGLDLFSS